MSDSDGNVDVTFQDKKAGLVGPHSIAGRAFVVSVALRNDDTLQPVTTLETLLTRSGSLYTC